MRWFGTPWPSPEYRAPVCSDDSQRVDVPLGMPCGHCDELVDEDDSGVLLPTLSAGGYVAGDEEVTYVAEHVECFIRSTAGPVAFLEGRCIHAGGTEDCFIEGQSKRDDARATWAWLQEHL